MQIIVDTQEALRLRRSLQVYIKRKKAGIKNIQKNLAKDNDEAEVTQIRKEMLARREADLKWAESLLNDLSRITDE